MKSWKLLAGAGMVAIAGSAHGQVQQAQPKQAGVAAGTADAAVEDIVVTAQRRPERLQNVPLSVTAISSDTLKTRNLNDLAQISRVAPSLQISTDNNFSIRGVGTQSFSSSIESSVAFAQDDVNLTNPVLVSDLFDVAQVEVLNGPQGLLFGRNASAGLLNVTTTRPTLGKFGGSFDLEADYRDQAAPNSNGVIVRPNINIPIGTNAALRLSGLYDYQSPIVNFVGPVTGKNDLGLRRYAFRGKFLYEPTDHLSVYIIGDYGEQHGALGEFDQTYRALGTGPGEVEAAPLAAVGIVPSDKNLDIAGNAGYSDDVKRSGVQGKVSYTLDNGIEISDIAAWKAFSRIEQIDEDGTELNGADVNADNDKFNQYSNELRLALPANNRLSGQVGIYLFHSDLRSTTQVAGNNFFPTFLLPTFPFCVGAIAVPGAFPPTCSASNDYFLGTDHVVHQTNSSYAGFGQLTYKITDKLQAFAGGRVTHDHISIDLTQNTEPYFVTLGIPFSGSEKYSHTNFSWKFGGQYNFNPNAMVYASYGRGYKGPGFNDNAVSQTESLVVKAETNKNIEVGAKTSWFNRKLVINLSLFKSTFSNYQVQSLDLMTSSFITQNAAKLRSKGIEGSIVSRPIPGLTLSASATLLNSKFADFAGAACYPSQCGVDANGIPITTFNAAGRRAPLAPKFTGTTEAIYELQTGGYVRPFIEANFYHRSPIEYNIAPAPGTRYGRTNIVGGSFGVHADNWRASIFCKNCTDQRVPVQINIDPGDSFAGITSYAQRFGLDSFRTIGLQLGIDF